MYHNIGMADKIKIVGAKEHNLKNVSLELPKNELVVLGNPLIIYI